MSKAVAELELVDLEEDPEAFEPAAADPITRSHWCGLDLGLVR